MRTGNTGRMCGVSVVAAAMLAVAGGAWAQPEPVLKGPPVQDRDVPGVRGGLVEGGERRVQERLPMPVFLESLRVLQGEDAAAEIRATPELEAKVKGMIEKFEKERREYGAKHRDELRKLREQASKRDRKGKEGGGGDEPMDAMQPGGDASNREETASKIREIERGSPKVEDLYKQVWEELSEPQRKAVDGKIDEWRKQQAKEREDRYVRERMAQRDRDGAAKPGDGEPRRPGPQGPEGRPMQPGEEAAKPAMRPELVRRRERLIRYFEQLSPEEQERILERLEQRIRDREKEREREREGGAPPERPAGNGKN